MSAALCLAEYGDRNALETFRRGQVINTDCLAQFSPVCKPWHYHSECSTACPSPELSFEVEPIGPMCGLELPCDNFTELQLFFEMDSLARSHDDDDDDPRTPRASIAADEPPPGPVSARRPALLTALMYQSLQSVEQAIEEEPESAQTPFWDHDVEPPLCAAVRLLCGADIVSLLLAHGADVHQEDLFGRTPLTLLRSTKRPSSARLDDHAITQVLVDVGAVSAGSGEGRVVHDPFGQSKESVGFDLCFDLPQEVFVAADIDDYGFFLQR